MQLVGVPDHDDEKKYSLLTWYQGSNLILGEHKSRVIVLPGCHSLQVIPACTEKALSSGSWESQYIPLAQQSSVLPNAVKVRFTSVQCT